MKKLILPLAVTVFAVHAFGQAAKKPVKPIHCAVMTFSKVDVAKATKSKMYADYKGRRYFFCCAGCPEAFKKNPAKYAKNDSIPVPKKGKKAKIA